MCPDAGVKLGHVPLPGPEARGDCVIVEAARAVHKLSARSTIVSVNSEINTDWNAINLLHVLCQKGVLQVLLLLLHLAAII